MHLSTNVKLECALFEVHTVIVRNQPEHEFSFRFESIVRGYHVYRGALNKKYFDNRIKPAHNSEYALISEMHLTTCEYGIRFKPLVGGEQSTPPSQEPGNKAS